MSVHAAEQQSFDCFFQTSSDSDIEIDVRLVVLKISMSARHQGYNQIKFP